MGVSIASTLVRAVAVTAARAGVATDELYAQARIAAAAVADPDARIDTGAYLRLFAAADARARDPGFGVHVAGAIDGAAFGLLGFLVATCPALGDALRQFARHARLLCDELSVAIERRADGEVALCYVLEARPHVPAFFEMAIAHMIDTTRRGTRGAFRPRRVVFRHRAPRGPARTLGGAPVEYGGNEDAVWFARSALALPLRGANATLHAILSRHAAGVLADLPDDDDLVARTRRAIKVLVPRGEVGLPAVAARLGTSGRTLQRQLRARDTTLRALVDDVRREHALVQLADPDATVEEVAFALGFSGKSAFHHAFRRWTGRAPRR